VELYKRVAFEGALVPEDSPICRAVVASHSRVTREKPRMVIAAGFTDAHYLIEGLGIPTITYGPGRSGMAHVPDEYVVVSDLVRCTQVLTGTTVALLT